MISEDFEGFRAGFVAVVGRPNAGKSTLTNALVGQKIAITANQPETTRKVIRGIVNLEHAQLILVDTPGLHRPRTLLGERLNDMVHETLADVDAVAICLPADEEIGPGDEFLLQLIAKTKAPIVAVVTKADKVSQDALMQKLMAVDLFAQTHGIDQLAQIVPTSAVKGRQIDDLAAVLAEQMPPSPPLYPRDVVTDESEEDLMAEFIREAALEGVRDELPHSIAVTIDEIEYSEKTKRNKKGNAQTEKFAKIWASVYVERDSQKGIIIGYRGARLKEVGQRARHEIEALLGHKIFLDIHIKVAKDWQRDPKQLGKLGF